MLTASPHVNSHAAEVLDWTVAGIGSYIAEHKLRLDCEPWFATGYRATIYYRDGSIYAQHANPATAIALVIAKHMRLVEVMS